MNSDTTASRIVGALAIAMLALILGPGEALPDRLELAEDAAPILHIGANLLLFLHIGGGSVGLLSGTVAILAPKGKATHRAAGKVYFISMIISFVVAAAVAPFVETGQRPNTIAAILSLYLLLSAWRAARSGGSKSGAPEFVGAFVAAGCAILGLALALMAATAPSGTVDDAPPQAFYIFLAFGIAGVYGDIQMLRRGHLAGRQRIVRHLWRMCATLFIAAGSFFIGQSQALPEWMIGTWLQFGPVLFPIAALIIWTVIQNRPRSGL